MYIRELTIESFEKIKNKTFDFKKGANMVLGAAGSGKTALADSLTFLFYGADNKMKSEARSDPSLLFKVSAVLRSDSGDSYSVEREFSPSDERCVLLNKTANEEISASSPGQYLFSCDAGTFRKISRFTNSFPDRGLLSLLSEKGIISPDSISGLDDSSKETVENTYDETVAKTESRLGYVNDILHARDMTVLGETIEDESMLEDDINLKKERLRKEKDAFPAKDFLTSFSLAVKNIKEYVSSSRTYKDGFRELELGADCDIDDLYPETDTEYAFTNKRRSNIFFILSLIFFAGGIISLIAYSVMRLVSRSSVDSLFFVTLILSALGILCLSFFFMFKNRYISVMDAWNVTDIMSLDEKTADSVKILNTMDASKKKMSSIGNAYENSVEMVKKLAEEYGVSQKLMDDPVACISFISKDITQKNNRINELSTEIQELETSLTKSRSSHSSVNDSDVLSNRDKYFEKIKDLSDAQIENLEKEQKFLSEKLRNLRLKKDISKDNSTSEEDSFSRLIKVNSSLLKNSGADLTGPLNESYRKLTGKEGQEISLEEALSKEADPVAKVALRIALYNTLFEKDKKPLLVFDESFPITDPDIVRNYADLTSDSGIQSVILADADDIGTDDYTISRL